MSQNYREAGVDLLSGYEVIARIKKHTDKTKNLGTMGSIGDFGGLFDLAKYDIKDPVLVSGTDGVGTKLLIAQEVNQHQTIGYDLVAMCVNDIITVGAKPLFFLDYIALGKTDPSLVEMVVSGIANACAEVNVALIGGETAEMPDMYQNNHYDLAGFAVGVVDRSAIIQKDSVQKDDIIIGLTSSGIHSNGYSLVRKVFFKDHSFTLSTYFEELHMTLGEELLKPTRLYVNGMDDLFKKRKIKSMAHITGGGFFENIPRALPKPLGVDIHLNTLPKLPIFQLIKDIGQIEHHEMYNVFNMGIGMVVIVNRKDAMEVLEHLNKWGYDARIIGEVTNTPGVRLL